MQSIIPFLTFFPSQEIDRSSKRSKENKHYQSIETGEGKEGRKRRKVSKIKEYDNRGNIFYFWFNIFLF